MTGIFKSYDIRGVYGKDLTDETARKIGSAFGTMNPGKIAVGMDARMSSPVLKERLIEGLVSAGCHMLDAGMVTSPMMLFAVGRYGLDGGVMVTASHNPKEYNGFKFYAKGALPISYESGISRIEKLVRDGNFSRRPGTAERKSITEDYSGYLLGKVRLKKGLRLVVDAGNGSAGKVNCDVLRKAGFEVIEMFCEPDGNFPNHIPDPSEPRNMEMLREKVKEARADMGISFDGDGDRVGIIDRHGNTVIPGDVFVMLSKHALAGNKGSKVVTDIACSMAIGDSVRSSGGIPVQCKVGHTYIAQKMRDVHAVFGGELSGHYFFSEIFGGDDALFAVLRLLEFLERNNTTFERESKEIPRYFTEVAENITIPVSEEQKKPMMERIKSYFRGKGYRVDELDGAKIFLENGWMLFRPSNTSPLIRYGFESRNKDEFERMKRMAEEVKAWSRQ